MSKNYLIPKLMKVIYDILLEDYCDQKGDILLLINSKKFPKEEYRIPENLLREETVLFDISPRAVSNLSLESQKISFNATFNGTKSFLAIPTASMMQLYSYIDGNISPCDPGIKGLFYDGKDEISIRRMDFFGTVQEKTQGLSFV